MNGRIAWDETPTRIVDDGQPKPCLCGGEYEFKRSGEAEWRKEITRFEEWVCTQGNTHYDYERSHGVVRLTIDDYRKAFRARSAARRRVVFYPSPREIIRCPKLTEAPSHYLKNGTCRCYRNGFLRDVS